jgi:predicted Zn finger-like uncharacterized protein
MRAADARATPEPAEVPAKCPSCGAREIVTTSKVVDESTYWRCATCGDVWNIARQREASRYVNRNPFMR